MKNFLSNVAKNSWYALLTLKTNIIQKIWQQKRVLGLKEKLTENQENRLFYATHIPFRGPEGGGGHVTKKKLFSNVAYFLPSGTY